MPRPETLFVGRKADALIGRKADALIGRKADALIGRKADVLIGRKAGLASEGEPKRRQPRLAQRLSGSIDDTADARVVSSA